jgi:energy-coupling factor transport system substrate-specific component
VSWTLASMLILGLALAAGFAWWERSRPPSRLLALVATLAALAALGRIAFAPIPNVKPTTDIVLFAGFALGAAPGFAVGAVAAVSSNFFFGQGPWTPWQMAAWGLVGLLGAGLARVMPAPKRIPLALACAAAGLLYGELLNTSLWVLYSDHSLTAWTAYAGSGVPFDLAHVIGNVVFCLAFGLAFVASLQRFRTRMSVRWIPAVAATLMLLALAPLAVAASPPAAYLATAQNDDGGFGGAPGQASSGLYTGWVALGLEAAGRHPADVKAAGGTSLLGYLSTHVDDLDDAGALSRTILVVEAAGADATSFGGHDLLGDLLHARNGKGAFEGRVNTTAFALLALDAAHAAPDGKSVKWLLGQANADGGFNFAGRGGPSGVDDTSAPIQALVAVGKGKTKVVKRAARFLVKARNPDGGFPLTPGGESNAQSTAWAVQALVAAGRSPKEGLRYLRSLTDENGAVRYSRTSDQTPVWVTAQALTALARTPFPLPAVARKPRPKAAATPAPRPVSTPTPEIDERRDRTARPDTPAAVVPEALLPLARRAGRVLAAALAVV